ncbi:MAG: hypothetical protein P9M06_06560 [Candidatus Saelkia tenebricola]|nr:hypothetical protein [Candidatus Saelkia tenebricola]
MKNKNGILIIEVLIGVVILSILVTSVIYGLEQTFKAFRKSNRVTKATYLAEGLLFQEIANPNSVEDNGVFGESFNSYAWEIKREIAPINSDFIKATVIIRDKRSDEFYARISSFTQETETTE